MAGECALCGLPITAQPVTDQSGDKSFSFCCSGCRQVFFLLSRGSGVLPEAFRESEIFRECLAMGIIPAQGRESAESAPATDTRDVLELNLHIEGMWCPVCAWLIREIAMRIKGVTDASVSFAADTASVTYLPALIAPADIESRIEQIGYRIADRDPKRNAGLASALALRLGISAVLSANVMMLSWMLYWGFFDELPQTLISYLAFPLLAISMPVLFYGGFPIFKRAALGLRYGLTSLETLVSVGALTAFCYSLLQMMQGSIHLYFDTATMLVTIVLLGKYIEERARQKASGGVADLHRAASAKVRTMHEDRPVWVRATDAAVGTEFAVRNGESVPLDCTITSNSIFVDESIITGESRPIKRGPGDTVRAGSTVVQGEMTARSIASSREGQIGQMVSLLMKAFEKKDRTEMMADRLMRLFVPAVVALAAGTGFILWWSGLNGNAVLSRSLTVLLISCPCALGIAIPLAKVMAIDIGKSKGLLIKEPDVLERIGKVTTFVFDKTGTLTEGRFALREIVPSNDHTILAALASVESLSSHLLAHAVIEKARQQDEEIAPCKDFQSYEGCGVSGSMDGRTIFIGNRNLMQTQGLRMPQHLEDHAVKREREGMTTAFFGWDKETRGITVFGDQLRVGSSQIVYALQRKGYEVHMLSGDSTDTTRAFARQIGITNVAAQKLPEEKMQIVRELRKAGKVVAMVGDGLNDTAALNSADIAICFGDLSQMTSHASQVIMLVREPMRILDLLDLAKATRTKSRQNLFFAFVYNMIAIPVAITGMLNPLIAVCAMMLSSLSVTANTLLLRKTGTAHLPSSPPSPRRSGLERQIGASWA